MTAGTRVFADGRWLGEGPFEGQLAMVEGVHEVRFEHRNHPVEVRSVRIERDKKVANSCTLSIPAPAPLSAAVAARRAEPARPSPGPWLTLASGGAIAGGAVGLQLWNHQRHDRWKTDRADIEAQPRPGTASEAAALDLRRRASNDRMTDIDRTDKVVTGLAVAGGLLVSAAAVWWWTRSHAAD